MNKRSDLLRNNMPILRQDSAPMYMALSCSWYIIALETHYCARGTPVHPDIEPYAFYLFLRVKNALMETHFQSVEDVKAKTADLLMMVTPNESWHCFEQ
ncbi:hypothetical protein TNCV_3321671 [Trichonephila clavipes]|nr:hypothetical protein TNCV_3321671 [Trichonephila clavipes]